MNLLAVCVAFRNFRYRSLSSHKSHSKFSVSSKVVSLASETPPCDRVNSKAFFASGQPSDILVFSTSVLGVSLLDILECSNQH